MRKTLFALLLAIILIIPSITHAGEGSTTWYGPWMNDMIDAEPNPFGFITWIQASNPNSYDATFEITYFKENGTPYTDSQSNSVFTHTVPAHGRYARRPNLDIQQASDEPLKGSYVINVTEGSITVDATITSSATSAIGNYDSYRAEGDLVSVWSKPPQTLTSTYLDMDSLIYYDSNNDRMATENGEAITWINLCNPSDDFDAEAEVTFYDDNGNIINSNPSAPIVLTFAPHETHTFCPGDYGMNGTSASSPLKGNVIVDVTKGSLVGCFTKHQCKTSANSSYSTLKDYRSCGAEMNKRLNVR